MITRNSILPVAFCLLCLFRAAYPAGPPPLSASVNAFTLDLYKAEASRSPDNLAVSGLSAHIALLMTYEGARSHTADEMAATLHVDTNHTAVSKAFRGFYDELQNMVVRDTTLHFELSNAIWTDRRCPLRSEFESSIANNFCGMASDVDFTQPERARRTINDWVSDRTHGRITDLLRPGDINQNIILVLTNTIWFRGKWAFPFNEHGTSLAPFVKLGGDTVSALMMRLVSYSHPMDYLPEAHAVIRAYETPDFQLLELPYRGNTCSMLILLPREQSALPQIEAELDSAAFASWTSQLAHPEGGYMITLPKLIVRSSSSLRSSLQGLGMRGCFDGGADFSGMFRQCGAWIADVIQGTYVDINEQGTEAAAATHVMMKLSAPEEPLVFIADHPYLFLIRDNHSGTILFAGRVTDPTK